MSQEPDYQAMFIRFKDATDTRLKVLATRSNPTRQEVHDLLTAFLLAISSARTQEQSAALFSGVEAGVVAMREQIIAGQQASA